jgi:Xaa-Pro dipeptidase
VSEVVPADDRIQQLARALGLDAIVATSPECVRYFSGVSFYHQAISPTELALLVWPAEKAPFLLAPDWTVPFAVDRARVAVRGWDWQRSPVDELAASLRDADLNTGCLGVELGHLPASRFEEARSALPDVQFVPVDDQLAALRCRKTEGEVETLAAAARIADAALAAGFSSYRHGMTERELALAIRAEAFREGADDVRWLFLASGERNRAGGLPTDATLIKGELVRADLGVVLDGYHADLARSAVVGSATRTQTEIYGHLWRAHVTALERFRPGLQIGDIARFISTELSGGGLDELDSYVGHSIGLGIHELPLIAPRESVPLEAGMVFCLEPAITHDGVVYHVEDMVLVTESEPIVLSRVGSWEQLPELGVSA